jgi:hypothetical protein
MSNSVVWKLQEPQPPAERDVSSAEEFGTIVEVLTPYELPSKQPDYCLAKMITNFEDFKEGDYIVFPGGDPLTPFIAGLALQHNDISEFFWLYWHRDNQNGGGFYKPIRIDLVNFKRMLRLQGYLEGE